MSVSGLIEGMHHTAISVRNYAEMRAFLTDFLGFEAESEFRERGELELCRVVGIPDAKIHMGMFRLGDHRVELFEYLSPVGRSVPPAQNDVALTHLAFRVSDIEAVHRRALEAGYTPVCAPQSMRGGVCIVFYLLGPEGVVVEFMQFPSA